MRTLLPVLTLLTAAACGSATTTTTIHSACLDGDSVSVVFAACSSSVGTKVVSSECTVTESGGVLTVEGETITRSVGLTQTDDCITIGATCALPDGFDPGTDPVEIVVVDGPSGEAAVGECLGDTSTFQDTIAVMEEACLDGDTVTVTFPGCLSSSCDTLVSSECTLTGDAKGLTLTGTAIVESDQGETDCTDDCGIIQASCTLPKGVTLGKETPLFVDGNEVGTLTDGGCAVLK